MEDENFKRAMPLVFFFSLFASFIFVVIPIYLSSIGLNGYEIGLLVAVYTVTSIFVSFPTGFINDRWTIRLTIIAGVAMMSCFFFGLGFFESFLIFIPLFFLGGLGNNIGEVSIRTLVYKAKTEGNVGEKFGTYNFVGNAARCLGLFIGGVLIFSFDFSLALKIIGILFLLIIPFVSFRPITKYKVRLGEYGRVLGGVAH